MKGAGYICVSVVDMEDFACGFLTSPFSVNSNKDQADQFLGPDEILNGLETKFAYGWHRIPLIYHDQHYNLDGGLFRPEGATNQTL
jgi:hypothetical protein